MGALPSNGSLDSHSLFLAKEISQTGDIGLWIYDSRTASSPQDLGFSEEPDPDGWSGWANPQFNIKDKPSLVLGYQQLKADAQRTENMGDTVLQIGPSSEEILKVFLPNMNKVVNDLWEVRIDGAKLSIMANGVFQDTIEYVSTERGRMGAYQNRLEHTIRTLEVNSENLTAAESRIRDTDMAEEITDYTKNQILLNAAQAMLGQSNAVPNQILNLLSS